MSYASYSKPVAISESMYADSLSVLLQLTDILRIGSICPGGDLVTYTDLVPSAKGTYLLT